MIGIVLNEEGYVTFPAKIFPIIETEVKSLNWRITNVECGGSDSYEFPFEHVEDYIIDGTELYDMVMEHPDIQWWWGVLSGIPKSVPNKEIVKHPIIDAQMDCSYIDKPFHHIDPDAVLEIVAFDSTETYVLADDEEIGRRLQKLFPKMESLEKYWNSDAAESCNISSIEFTRWSDEPEKFKRKIIVRIDDLEVTVRNSITGTEKVNEFYVDHEQDGFKEMISETGIADYRKSEYPDEGMPREGFVCKYKVRLLDGTWTTGVLNHRNMNNPLEKVMDWLEQNDEQIDMSWFTGNKKA